MGQALPPVSAVTKEDSNPSLLPKEVEGLGQEALRLAALYFRPSYQFKTTWLKLARKAHEKGL